MNSLMLAALAHLVSACGRTTPIPAPPPATPVSAAAIHSVAIRTPVPQTDFITAGPSVVSHSAPATKVVGIGVGYPPPGKQGAQARLLARRAAEVRATADLARRLRLPSGQRLRGVQYVSYRVRVDGSVEVMAVRTAR